MSIDSDFDDDDEGTAVLSLEGMSFPTAHVGTPFLIILAGDGVGRMLRVDEELTVGRSPKASVVFTGEGVSRYHARFFRKGDTTFVEDLGSTNGTFVNGARLTAPMALTDGDKIQIGASFLLKFSLQDALEQSFQQELYEAALRDPLTQVYNRRALTDRLETELSHVARHGSTLTLLLLDLDHFKRVNDTFGHLAGDHVLRTFASLVSGMIRREDFFARYGGEEFALVGRSMNVDEAQVLAERIRATVANTPIVFDSRLIAITVSVGIAGTWPGCTMSELVGAADAALYATKHGGRDRVVTYHASR